MNEPQHHAIVAGHRGDASQIAAPHRKTATRGTVVLGVAASDAHVVANHLIAMFLRRQHFEVINLGACTPTEDFMKAASRATNLVAVLIGSLNGHAVDDLADLPRLRERYGVGAPVLVGGNLSVGAIKDDSVTRQLHALGVDMVLDHPRQLMPALRALTAPAPDKPLPAHAIRHAPRDARELAHEHAQQPAGATYAFA